MIQAFPNCGSPDVNVLEIAETEADCVYECEACDTQYNGDEVVGGGE